MQIRQLIAHFIVLLFLCLNLILALSVSFSSRYFLILLIFLCPNSSGIRVTSSGLIFLRFNFSKISKLMYLSIKSKGHFPSKLSLKRLFI